jgi:hypothetical protein
VQGILQGANTAYFWDHHVKGKRLLPGAAMFEAARAAGALLLTATASDSRQVGDNGSITASIASVSIPAPLSLPACNNEVATLTNIAVAVDAATGKLKLTSITTYNNLSDTSTHLAGAYACILEGKAASNWTDQLVHHASHLMLFQHGVWTSAGGLQQLPSGIAGIQKKELYSQFGQYHVHPAVTDNATQVRSPPGYIAQLEQLDVCSDA